MGLLTPIFAKGFEQGNGLDYEDNFIHVVKAVIVRLRLSVALSLQKKVSLTR
jgi:hypothetical protein